MTRHESLFVTDGELLIVECFVTGPLSTVVGRFVIDTGAVVTTLQPEFTDSIGYSARDGIRRARIRSAIGSEEGYLLSIAEFEALGVPKKDFLVHVFDLGYDDIDGLLGLNFLSDLNHEVRSAERRILVEKIHP